ncbi:MAG: VapC toxin family PIN domain ribonuclease [Ferruginibacter sp.]|nr:VapC toxin family PIN domain ribonuclease [Rhodoferax sp.]
MILVDTSIWSSHFSHPNENLMELLKVGHAACHPLVIAEIACGTPPQRSKTLKGLNLIPQTNVATLSEVLEFIESERFFGRGCGFTDLSLLKSVMLTRDAKLWTADKRLAALATEMQVLYVSPLH